jgi:hypothetical protein
MNQNSGQCPDMVLLNGKIITVNHSNTIDEAVAIKDEIITVVGDSDDVKAMIGDETIIIDLQGKTVVPGFIDSHVHLDCSAVHTKLAISCHIPPAKYIRTSGEVNNLDDILVKIRENVNMTPKGKWIIGQGRFSLETDGNSPTKEQLDAISPDHPVMIRYSAHCQILNSKALELAKINKVKPTTEELEKFSPGAKILRNPDSREPTGIIVDACDWIFPNSSPWHYEQIKDAIKETCWEAVRFGVTSIHEFNSWPETTKIYQDLFREGELPLRIQLCPTIYGMYKTVDLDCLLQLGLETGFGNEWIKFGSVKIFVDSNGLDESGKFNEWDRIKPQELNELVAKAHKAGLRVMMHACNRNGQNMALDAVEGALKDLPKKDHRHRIEHFGGHYWRSELERLKKIRVIPVPTPYSSYGWYGDEWLKSASPHEKVTIYRTLLDEKLLPPGNSDCMGTEPEALNPWWSIWCVVERKTRKGKQICPEEGVTVMDAIRIYTMNSAYSGFEERIKGSIEVGKIADLVILTKDPLTVAKDEIQNIEAEMTIIGGKIVYQKK